MVSEGVERLRFLGANMNKTAAYFSAILVLVCLSGCSDRSVAPSGKPARAASRVVKSIINPEIPDDAAVALVNGQPVKKADLDDWIDLRGRVYLANKQVVTTAARQVRNYSLATGGLALSDLVRRELVRQRCVGEALETPEDLVVAAQRDFMNGIRKPRTAFADYLVTLPVRERNLLERQVFADAQGEMYLAHWVTNDCLVVTDAEVSNRIDEVKRYNENVERMNQEARRRAAEAKAEILGGRSFYEVTTNRADIFREQGREWDTLELGELDTEEDLFVFLSSAQAGDISDPIDFDDGIGIVGVVMKEKGEVPEGVVAADQYTVVRCVFNAYETMDAPEEFAAMKKEMLKQKKDAARMALVDELYAAAKIELPYGDRLFAVDTRKSGVKGGRAKRKSGKSRPKKAKVQGNEPVKETINEDHQ